jgi:hypothetical protein
MTDETTDADYAEIGRSLVEQLPKGYVYSDNPAEIVTDYRNRIDYLAELLTWAHGKLRAFGIHNGKQESAMRMDAIELELRSLSPGAQQEEGNGMHGGSNG